METLSKREYSRLKSLVGRKNLNKKQQARLESLQDKCLFLGKGCGRKTFLINLEGYSKPFVLKFAHFEYNFRDVTFSGIYQNKYAISIYNNFTHRFIPDFYDWDEEGRWIEVEYLKKVPGRPSLKAIEDFSKMVGLSIHDTRVSTHWGINGSNKWKLMDMGLSANRMLTA